MELDHSASYHTRNWLPLPMDIVLTAANKLLSTESQGVGVPFHGLSSELHSNHYHCNRRALLKAARSLMPRPPYSCGVQIFFQLTKHSPPVASSSGAQRKLRLSLSNFLTIHFSAGKAVRKYVAVAVATLLIRMSRPLRVIIFPFPPFSLATTLSNSGCTSILFGFLKPRGSPRY